MMNKILHVSKYYYPYPGGVEDVCYNIVRTLQQQGFPQQVICFNDTRQTIRDTYEGIEVTRVGTIRKIASQAISLRYKKALRHLLETFRPDIVHFHAPNPFAAHCLLQVLPADIRLIVHWHSDIVAQKNLYRLIKPVETKLLRRCDTIIATSPNYITQSEPLQRFKTKVTVIQNVIDPSKFTVTPTTEEQVQRLKDRYGRKPILLFVGRHVPYKGLQHLIEAIPGVTADCAVLIGGTGPLTRSLAAGAPDHVHFLGRIPADQLSAYFHAADLFVFPSVTKNEAFGVALAEAMYCKTPAITFTIPGSGVNWVNRDGQTGLEVENGNTAALAAAIDRLITDQDLRTKLGLQAQQRVQELFTIETIREQLCRLYTDPRP